MKSGICPKCSAECVRRIASSWYSTHSNVFRYGFFGSVRLTNYVCARCGYHESYVESPADLGMFAELGTLVEPMK